ncbi:MAG TPA: hypothetical protein VGO03_05165 [Acidimicrobiia bacterium]|jgi:hypothetical protein
MAPTISAGAVTPNTSLLFYRSPGSPTAARATVNGGVGLLANGAFSLTRQIHFTEVTTVAASCDTILVYAASNGFATAVQASGGTLIGLGNNYNFDPHWTTITATDDSALFYNKTAGTGAWGTLKGGMFAQTGSSTSFSKGLTNIGGTSNSLLFYTKGSASGSTATLSGGVYEFHGAFGGLRNDWAIISGGK